MKRGMHSIVLSVVISLACLISIISLVSAVIDSGRTEIVIPIKIGWNLIPVFAFELDDNSPIKIGDFSYVYVYDYKQNKYLLIMRYGEELDENDYGNDYEDYDQEYYYGELFTGYKSLFAYSEIEGNLRLDWDSNKERRYSVTNTNRPWKLKQGWNLLVIIPKFLDYKLDNFKGNCSILKAVHWNADIKKWEVIDANKEINEHLLGKGFALKVAGDCVMKDSLFNYPDIIGSYELNGQPDIEQECQELDPANQDELRALNITKKITICFKNYRLEYHDDINKKGISVNLFKVTEGIELYEKYITVFGAPADIGVEGIYKVEAYELWWFYSDDFMIATREYSMQEREDGGTNYGYQDEATGNNPVARWFIANYPPKRIDVKSSTTKPKCEDYRYSTCPEGCVKRCVPSVCTGATCTADCEGVWSCRSS